MERLEVKGLIDKYLAVIENMVWRGKYVGIKTLLFEVRELVEMLQNIEADEISNGERK